MIHRIKKYFRSKPNKFYQSELIEKLHTEHQKLVEIVLEIEQALEESKIRKIKKLLKNFAKELELHLLYEDTNLYEHLYIRYFYYTEIKEKIQAKHNEMKEIAEVVKKFLETHKELKYIEAFRKDFETIKSVLVKRVEFEEGVLYDIYNNVHKKEYVLKMLSEGVKGD